MSPGTTATRDLPEDRPAVEVGRDEVDRAPLTASPAASTASWTCVPLCAGSSDGWMLTIRPAQRATKASESSRI